VRAESHLSIRALARRTGVSPATIQKIEADSVSPTVSTLFKIARGLNKAMSVFLGEHDDDGASQVSFTARGSRMVLPTGRPRLRMERIAGSIAGQAMDAHRLLIPPGEASGKELLVHGSEEIAVCLRGRLDFRVAGRAYRLGAGDTLHLKGSIPHSWINRGRGVAELLVVFAPPVVL
jgi:transcriptional regulator with XRE-family HTH domain